MEGTFWEAAEARMTPDVWRHYETWKESEAHGVVDVLYLQSGPGAEYDERMVSVSHRDAVELSVEEWSDVLDLEPGDTFYLVDQSLPEGATGRPAPFAASYDDIGLGTLDKLRRELRDAPEVRERTVVAWDWGYQPDWESIDEAMRALQRDTPPGAVLTVRSVPDMPRDEYGVVFGFAPLTDDDAQQAWHDCVRAELADGDDEDERGDQA
jgi:hypothetical protein